MSELTARTNDEGWSTVFAAWLKVSHLTKRDVLFVMSVGGGSLEKNISPNLVTALDYGKEVGARIIGIVGRDGGYTARVADACVVIPTVNPATSRPTARPSRRSFGTCWSRIPLSRLRQRSGRQRFDDQL